MLPVSTVNGTMVPTAEAPRVAHGLRCGPKGRG
jgi:hypothetical protein